MQMTAKFQITNANKRSWNVISAFSTVYANLVSGDYTFDINMAFNKQETLKYYSFSDAKND